MALVTPHKLVQQVCLVLVDLVLGLAGLVLLRKSELQEPALLVFRSHKLVELEPLVQQVSSEPQLH